MSEATIFESKFCRRFGMVPLSDGQIAENLDSAEPLGEATIGTFKSWLPSKTSNRASHIFVKVLRGWEISKLRSFF